MQSREPNPGVLGAPTSEAEFAAFVERVRSGAGNAEHLVPMLHGGHEIYAGRGANQVARMRGYLLASFETLGLPEAAFVYVLEVLENSQKPYLVAAAAKALRGMDRPSEQIIPYLRLAISNVQFRDDALSFDSYAPDWPRADFTTALAEIVETLRRLGPSTDAATDLLRSMNSSKVFNSDIRHRAAEALQFGHLRRGSDKANCCSIQAKALKKLGSEKRCRTVGPMTSVILEDQDGHKMPFEEAFVGRPTILGFFYTRCGNPNKCSLTVTKLGQLKEALRERGIEGLVNVAAITYDPGFDTPERLRGYCENRGFRFDNTSRAWRCEPRQFDAIRAFFDLGATFVSSVVSRHEIEVYLLDSRVELRAAFTKLQWSVQNVAEEVCILMTGNK